MPAGSRAVLAAAHEAHARGDLFRQVKGRVVLEVQDGDIVVAEDAADDEANEEDDAGEGLLVEEFDADEGAVVEHAGAPAGAAPSSSTLEKVMAQCTVGGRIDYIRVTVRISRKFTARIVLRTNSNFFFLPQDAVLELIR